ncbi:hypothetical protein [Halotalea alkalilenta]|uniref:hypothetical protein n=1 Tax=Halotalea alkalilenta TaxID=376489 RepID=UPI000481E0B7|nr:hypothetical protein [Halotalea alkalilenta]
MSAIDWEEPGKQGVDDFYAGTQVAHPTPKAGDVVSARYRDMAVRVEVERHADGVSHGRVVAILDAKEKRHQSSGGLAVGDAVSLPDRYRAFEPKR